MVKQALQAERWAEGGRRGCFPAVTREGCGHLMSVLCVLSLCLISHTLSHLIHTANPGKGDVFPFLLMKKVRLR